MKIQNQTIVTPPLSKYNMTNWCCQHKSKIKGPYLFPTMMFPSKWSCFYQGIVSVSILQSSILMCDWEFQKRKERPPGEGARPARTKSGRVCARFSARLSYFTRAAVSMAIMSSSLVGMSRTFTLESAAEITASSPRTLLAASSIFTPMNSSPPAIAIR